MPASCEVCGNTASWFWSRCSMFFSTHYCSFTCQANDMVAINSIFGSIISLIGLLTITSFGFAFLILGLALLGTAYYGHRHKSSKPRMKTVTYKRKVGEKEPIRNYDKYQY